MVDLFDVVAATWPAAGQREAGGFVLRRGDGGGNRTSAATRAGGPADIALAEAGMRDWGQVPHFLLRPGEDALDAELAALVEQLGLKQPAGGIARSREEAVAGTEGDIVVTGFRESLASSRNLKRNLKILKRCSC